MNLRFPIKHQLFRLSVASSRGQYDPNGQASRTRFQLREIKLGNPSRKVGIIKTEIMFPITGSQLQLFKSELNLDLIMSNIYIEVTK